MSFFEALLLGVVQGVFIFVPVSSTSHLVLTQHWLISRGSGMPPPESPEMILFDLVVHMGTLISVAVVFRASLVGLGMRVVGDLLGRCEGGRTGRLRPPPAPGLPGWPRGRSARGP